jgi:hypothetical protein
MWLAIELTVLLTEHPQDDGTPGLLEVVLPPGRWYKESAREELSGHSCLCSVSLVNEWGNQEVQAPSRLYLIDAFQPDPDDAHFWRICAGERLNSWGEWAICFYTDDREGEVDSF